MKTIITEPQVFIIESLGEDDFREGRTDGKYLSDILNMDFARVPIYKQVSTENQFIQALEEFHQTNYRYLHLSSHGEKSVFALTSADISIEKFAELTEGKLVNRRLFISACNVANKNLANLLIPKSGVYSIIGSYEPIDFDTAAIFWASFYYLSYKNRGVRISMNRNFIESILKPLTRLYQLNLNYFYRTRKNTVGLAWFLKGKLVRKESFSTN